MDNNPSNRTKRLAFVISGAVDAVIGAGLMLLGFGVLPVDVRDYGFQNWQALALGAAMFIPGVGMFVYNLSRLEE